MKTVLLASLVLILASATVFAGGDKVRGDKGQGGVNQEQVQDPPPFEDDEESLINWLLGIEG
jgi:hypothetical protein